MIKLTLTTLGGLALATAGAFGLAGSGTDRADCPGKISCPLTGEILCRDQCPTIDPDREDCPGRIECPLTGELICVDQCPVDQKGASIAVNRPSCCKQ
jgi:hypothetical protein